MQCTIKEELKQLMNRILCVLIGIVSVLSSGQAQKNFPISINVEPDAINFLELDWVKITEYNNSLIQKRKNSFVSVLSDTISVTDTVIDNTVLLSDSAVINICAETSWEKISPRNLYWNLKTNLLYAATLTPNLGLEISWGTQLSLNITGSYNPWNRKGKKGDNDKIVHWMAQPELRYWFCEPTGGHFIGIHAIVTKYNIGGHKFFHIFDKGYRYEGWGVGGGFTYGYSWFLSKKWAIEGFLGIGVVRLGFDKSNNRIWCCTKSEHFTKTYFGLTKVGISLIYNIK